MVFESNEEVGCAVIWGKNIPDRGSEAGVCLCCSVGFEGFFLGGGLLVFLEISEKINVTGVDFEGREI